MEDGFIPLGRSFFDHPLWNEPRTYSKAEAWIDLIREAGWKNRKKVVSGKLVEVPRGAVVATVRFLSVRWLWSKTKVCRFLSVLEIECMIKTEKGQGVNIIQLLNYERFNCSSNTQETEEVGQEKDKKETQKRQEKDTNGTKKRQGKDELEEGEEGKQSKQVKNPIHQTPASASPDAEEKKPFSKKSESTADPRFTPVVTGYCEAYAAAIGEPYVFNGGRDGLALNRLLKGLANAEYFTIERIVGTAKKAIERRKMPFSKECKHAANLHSFCAHYNDIRAELKTPETNGYSHNGHATTATHARTTPATPTIDPALFSAWVHAKYPHMRITAAVAQTDRIYTDEYHSESHAQHPIS